MKSILRRLANCLHRESDSTRNDLSFESLESRLLFSAAPVEAPAEEAENPDAGNEAPTADVQVEAQSAQATGAAVTEAESSSESEAAPVPVAGDSSISQTQGVTLLEVGETSGNLNQETLDAIAEAAAQRWRATGLSDAQSAALDAIDYRVGDLPGNQLGTAEGSSITLDDNAGGRGWFIDATPLADEEFDLNDGGLLMSTFGESGNGHDLLTVLMHEQGHVLGIDDQAANFGPDHVMSSTIGAGMRRLPTEGLAEGHAPGSLDGAHFIATVNGTPGIAFSNSTTTLSSFTAAAGTDRLLVVFAYEEFGDTITLVEYGTGAGTTNDLTLLGGHDGGFGERIEVWYKVLASTGAITGDIVMTDNASDTGTHASLVAAVVYDGVDQGTPIDLPSFISEEDLSLTVSSEAGDLVVGAGINFGADHSAGTSQSEIHHTTDLTAGGDFAGGAEEQYFVSSSEAGGTTITHSYSGTSGFSLAFNVNASAAAPLEGEIVVEHVPTVGPQVEIGDGDTTPSPEAEEGTDFGNTTSGSGMVTRTFEITNDGTAVLTLTGPTPVTVTGVDASHFTVTQPSVLTLAIGQTETFTVTFAPTADGYHDEAVIHIASDDTDEADFDFEVEGIGSTVAASLVTQLGSDDIAFGPNTTSLSSFTVDAGSNRLLVVYAYDRETAATSDITGVSYGAMAMTKAGTTVTGPLGEQLEIYTLKLASGAAMTFDITMTNTDVPGDTEGAVLAAVAYENVDQTTPFDGFDKLDGSGDRSRLLIDSEAGDRVIGAHANLNVGGGGVNAVPTVGGAPFGQTVIHDEVVDVANFFVSSTEAGGLVVDLIHDWDPNPTPSQNFVSLGLNLNGVAAPEITVEHDDNGDEIADGETGTSGFALEGTDFGTADITTGMVTRTFRIRNDGNSTLTLTGQPMISGTGATHFMAGTVADLMLAPAQVETFTVTFDPSAAGVHDATITILSDDSDESPYNFEITGEGTTAAGPPATEESGVSISGTNLVITDVLGGDTDDDLTISISGTTLTIEDNNGNGIDLGAVTGTGDGTSTVTIDLGVFAGGIVFDTLGGNDTLRIDFDSGNFDRAITFNGGIQPVGDQLFLEGSGTFAEVTYDFSNENDGNIMVAGNSLITYTGLEPITSTITAGIVTLNYNGGAETIGVTASGTSTRVDSTAGEVVTFTNPSTLLTINAGSGDDTINVDGFGAGFGAGLTIDGQGGSGDTINYNADGVVLTGSNSATFTAERILFFFSDLTTDSGSITATGTGSSGGNFQGVFLVSSSLATGSGGVTLTGEGGDTGSNNQGVLLTNTSSVTSTGGTIDITGTGHGAGSSNQGVVISVSTVSTGLGGALNITGSGSTAGTSSNEGVSIYNAGLTVFDGDINIVGTGAGSLGLANGINVFVSTLSSSAGGGGSVFLTGSSTGSSWFNNGLAVNSSTISTATGTGSITLNGTGSSSGLSYNEGVSLSDSDLATGGNGDIVITGQGGGTTGGSYNRGVTLSAGSTAAAAGTGGLTIDGSGGAGSSNIGGVSVSGGTALSTVNGALTVRGTASGDDHFNRGLEVSYSTITTTGPGAMTLRGTGSATSTGGYYNTGVYLVGSTVSATIGDMTIDGVGGSGNSYNEGVYIFASSVTTGGKLDIDGRALSGTTGYGNSGVFIYLGTVNGNGSSTIDGTGGGGLAINHGVAIYATTSNVPCANIVGMAGLGAGSEDETGDFFPC